eukprot:1429727-Alexandrium_andersonii.AAC.1
MPRRSCATSASLWMGATAWRATDGRCLASSSRAAVWARRGGALGGSWRGGADSSHGISLAEHRFLLARVPVLLCLPDESIREFLKHLHADLPVVHLAVGRVG